MKLLVGCPVKMRSWIIPAWFEHIQAACAVANIRPDYAFVVPKADPTLKVIRDQLVWIGGNGLIETTDEKVDYLADHIWKDERLHQMVGLRNQLLSVVRLVAPDLFWSVDSDILVHPDSLHSAMEGMAQHPKWVAVGGRCYMDRGRGCPSHATVLANSGMLRPDHEDYATVGAIMAMKLMTPMAYDVDYRYHFQGEDLGWSAAVKELYGGECLGYDGRLVSKHVMKPDELDVVDARCGF